MAGNHFCSCGLPAEYFCICQTFPRFCASHKTAHESKGGFHFASPIGFFEWAESNKQEYAMWVGNLSISLAKLKAEFLEVNQCRNQIEAAFAVLFAELTQMRSNFLETLHELETLLRAKVDEVITEASTCPFYSGSSHLAVSIYQRCYEANFKPLEVFTYQVTVTKECLQDCLDVSFHTVLPELSSWNREATGGYLKKEVVDLRAICKQFESEGTDFQDSYPPQPPQGSPPAFSRSPSRLVTSPSQVLRSTAPFPPRQGFSKSQPQSPKGGHFSPLLQPSPGLRSYLSEQEMPVIQDEPGRAMYWHADGRPQTARWLNMPQQGQEIHSDEPGGAAFAPAGGLLPGNRPMTTRKHRNSQPDIGLHLPSMPRAAQKGPGDGKPEGLGQSPRFTGT